MIVLSWNVQGLCQPRKQKGIGGVIREKKAKVCGLYETKCHGHDMDAVVGRVAPGWKFSSNFHLDSRARILVLWDPAFVEVEIVTCSVQHIGCLVTCKTTGAVYGCCFVYGLHSVVDRRLIWSGIEELLEDHEGPWMVMGDFNCVMAAEERSNGEPVSMYECQDMIDACRRLGLVDSPSTSRNPFTWTNHTVWSKLDRVMVNSSWHNADLFCHTDFPDMWHLSDHKPGIVSLRRVAGNGKKSFKFFNMWADHSRFLSVVRDGWVTHHRGTYQFRLCKLLQNMKAPLKALNRQEFSHISSRAAEANLGLSLALEELRMAPDSLEARGRVERAKTEARRLNEAEASFLGQLAKAKHVLRSDRCTRYFHGLMRANGRRAHIPAISRHDGSHTTSMDEVAQEFVGFYKSLFGTDVDVMEPGADCFAPGGRVLDSDCQMLAAPVSNAEIKAALWSIGDDKAPGPDGFTAKFFKSTWDITGAEVCAAVKEFFINGKLLRQVNHTIISLIPKVEQASFVEQYRPISCCNVIYKIISKVMTSRLSKCLAPLIDPAQSAFVAGRLMSDNIFLVQELLRKYEVKRDTRRCFLNVDLAKAYDTISWRFLRFALTTIGLPQRFVDWVMECVSSTTYSIRINGELHDWFPGRRGLRQGDPLSPLLFVICMEFLSRMIKRETATAAFRFHQFCEDIRLSHLIFADDVVLFCRGDLSSVKILMGCLRRFEEISGLAVNVAKSSIFLASVPDSERAALIAETGFRVGSFPFRYLGIPISPHGLRVTDYQPLLDRIGGYLSAWARKSISFAGRRELISSVLQGCEGFWLSILPVPALVLTRLTALCRNFLWRRPRVRWDTVCMPRREGGIGLLDIGRWNRSFMVKHFWHILSMRDSVWVRWVHHRYLRMVDPLGWMPHRRDSPLIKAIIHARDLIIGLEDREESVEVTLSEWCLGGRFRVARAYGAIRNRGPTVSWAKEVWRTHNTPKHCFILWLAVLGRLSTYDRLTFLDVDTMCRLCGADLETHDHLFFECPYSQDVWREISDRFKLPGTLSSLSGTLVWLGEHARGRSCLARARVYALSATVYFIWHARNARVFDNNLIPVEVVARLIATHVFRLLHDSCASSEIEILY